MLAGESQPRREFLLDVTRLIWRAWMGRSPTGIDRVCLAYLAHYGSRAYAVIQYKSQIFVLSGGASDRLFALLLQPRLLSRKRLSATLIPTMLTARRAPPRQQMTYFNVGHIGLNEAALPSWIERNGVRAIHFVHDLIPLTHPQYCRVGEAEKHERRMANALASARGLVTNSRSTLNDLTAFANSRGIEMPPCAVAWIAGHSHREQCAPTAVGNPYFVTVGTIEGRKNHSTLIRVWKNLVKRLGERTPLLVVIGARGWEAEETHRWLDQLGDLAGHVREIGSCGDQELSGWIAGARALLMPSFAEGFGLPVVEALGLGTPVIASDLPALREIAGGIPTYLDPNDVGAWERAVQEFLGDGTERERQLAEMASFSAPTWSEHFAVVDAWLATL